MSELDEFRNMMFVLGGIGAIVCVVVFIVNLLKGEFKKFWVVTFLVCIAIVIAGDPYIEDIQTNTTSVDGVEKTKKPKDSEWVDVIEFKGKSIKNTQTFKITSREWRVLWATEPGEFGAMNFQIFAYKEGSDLPEVIANVIGDDEDISYMRGKGDYYFTISTGQPYAILVQEKR